jgi:hypothetical protein
LIRESIGRLDAKTFGIRVAEHQHTMAIRRPLSGDFPVSETLAVGSEAVTELDEFPRLDVARRMGGSDGGLARKAEPVEGPFSEASRERNRRDQQE